MMGSGKTTLGRLLAERLGYSFIDTDDIIEMLARKTCRTLIREGTFAHFQTEAIMAFTPLEPMIIATGGSVAMYQELVRHLAKVGTSVFINVNPLEIQSRLSAERLASLNTATNENLEEITQKRIPLYRAAAEHELTVTLNEPTDISLEKLIDLLRIR